MSRSADPGHPLTAAQAEVWFDDQAFGGRLGYAMADYLDIHGPLDAARLKRALRDLATEAECIRARFAVVDDVPRQFFETWTALPYQEIDLSGEADPVAAATGWMNDDLRRGFDLSSWPLTRTALLRLGDRHSYLYLSMHHALCDGYSRRILYQRLARLYTGDGTAAAALPPFRHLLAAERRYLESHRAGLDRTYWLGRLAGAPEPVTLSSRLPALGQSELRRSAHLPEMSARGLRALAADVGVSLPAVVLAAVAGYTQRVAGGGQETMLTLPVIARTDALTRAIPGMMANYLPVRLAVRPQTTRGELIREAARELFAGLRHQRRRGEAIRRDMGLRADDSRPFGPIVNVLPQDPTLSFGACRADLVNLSTGMINDLSMTVLDAAGGGIDLHMDANPELYRMAELEAHLAALLEYWRQFAEAEPGQPLGRLDVLARADLAALGQTPLPRPEEYTGVPERLAALARRAPSSIAVDDGTRTVTYAELTALSGRIAGKLRPNSLIGLLAVPDAGFVAAVLGILRAGAAWVPLDVTAPLGRSAAFVADTGADVIIADEGRQELARRIVAACAHQVRVLAPAGRAGQESRKDAGQDARDDAGDLAYVIFTSGSTGRPKGAMVHRAGMVNHLLAKVEDLDLSAADVVVANAPVTFDVSVWQMLAVLLVGGRVRVVGPETAGDPDALFSVVAAESVTILEVVPSLLRATLDLWDDRGDNVRLPALRRLVVTGEPLPRDLCARWHARFPSVPIVNAYGPTECSDDVTHAVIEAGAAPGGRVPIGRPIRNTRLYVLGDELRPVPRGTIGDLYVGGTGVGRGYVGDPARTAAAFVADPFGPPGTRMYRTGDRVVARPDGQLEFVERRDQQVKLHGRRVELGEIEDALGSADGVIAAAAAVSTGPSGHKQLVGYLVCRDEIPIAAVRDHVASLLPDYMIPAAWLVLDELPLTTHGKLDRRALPVPSPGPRVTRPASTVKEKILCPIAAELFGQADVSADDDFFDVGGDSILAIQMIGQARAAGLIVTVHDIFAGKTLAAIAASARLAGEASGPEVLELRDPARRHYRDDAPRPIRVHLWSPANRSGSTPVVVLSHGTGGAAADLAWLGARLAGAGFLAAGIDHHGNNYLDGFVPEGFAFWWDRALDVTVVLDHLAASGPLGSVGIAGYSLGGHTAAAVLGARIARGPYTAMLNGSLTLPPVPGYPNLADDLRCRFTDADFPRLTAQASGNYADPRVRAGLLLAPALGPLLDEASLAAIEAPVAIRWGDADTDAAPEQNARRYAALIPTAEARSVGAEIGHNVFSGAGRADTAADAGADPGAWVRDQTATEAVAFFAAHL